MITTVNFPSNTSARHPLETQRLWIAAAGWLLLLAAFLLLLLKASWVSVALGVPLLIPFWWLFSLHLIGQKPPASLLRLDIAGFARCVVKEVKAAALRSMNAVPASESGQLPSPRVA